MQCILLLSLILYVFSAQAVDFFDPNGNITVIWDILRWTEEDGYEASVKIYNQQIYRHVEAPGWRLSWTWAGDEVIWTVQGAQARNQDDCSRIKKDHPPHSCAKSPVMIDLKAEVPEGMKTANCCRGGVLSSLTQDPTQSVAQFTMTVGGSSKEDPEIPQNFTFGNPGPGYFCTPAERVNASLIPDYGQRNKQAFRTWKLFCVYEQYQPQRLSTCCVSLSSFYNPKIIPCAQCACDCSASRDKVLRQRSSTSPICSIRSGGIDEPGPLTNTSQLYCSEDMCPVKVHWHVKANYKGFWRAKLTVMNRHAKNYTNWNLVVQHPNLKTIKESFSFNTKSLPGNRDAVLFWGLSQYNDMLLEAGPDGLVQSELMFNKDSSFTLRKGWAFPHKVLFNGDECSLPPPDSYPTLPNSGMLSSSFATLQILIVVVVVFL